MSASYINDIRKKLNIDDQGHAFIIDFDQAQKCSSAKVMECPSRTACFSIFTPNSAVDVKYVYKQA